PAAPHGYPLALHDALPISKRLGERDGGARDHRSGGEEQRPQRRGGARDGMARVVGESVAGGEVAREVQVDPRVVEREAGGAGDRDRKSTRLNSSHLGISYA